MTARLDYLGRFLAQARTIGRMRILRESMVDLSLGLALTALVAATSAGVTLRGDLARPLGAGLVALVGAGLLWALRQRLRSTYGTGAQTGRATAHTISRTPGPLRHVQSDPALEAALRHEILGATELQREGAQSGSPELARHYVHDVGRRLDEIEALPALAVPRPRWLWRVRIAAVSAALGALASGSPAMARGFDLLWAGEDGRPSPPPEPVWSTLELTIAYPDHTARPERTVRNPSGAVRAPAGTRVTVRMTPRHDARAGAIVVTHDAMELAAAIPPDVAALESTGHDQLQGTFTLRAAGTWTLVLLDDPDDDVDDAAHRSAAFPLQLEPDRPPEVELLPLPADQREVTDTDQVQIRFRARDDFGITSGQLIYQLPDGESQTIPLGQPPADGRSWKERHDWDLSSIPMESRGEVLYWVEIRDNDPGLGLNALPDPPGKLARSATMRLLVKDEEAEHAQNIESLRKLRDAAIDLLATRLTATAFNPGSGSGIAPRLGQAREILQRDEELLGRLTAAADALSVDALARDRHAELLASVRQRLAKLHEREAELHLALPPDVENHDPGSVPGQLMRLGAHNGQATAQLEDEIIRIDDLVDEQLLERLEALLARLRVTQQKLVELLQQLKSGDESVRPLIEQLEQRRRQDLRRIAELRAQLRKEVGDEFMNQDAFEVLRRMQQQEGMSLDQRLERERQQLQELQGLHDQVQNRLGAGGPGGPQLSEEDRARMKLLRELSRLQDEQTALRSATRRLDERWRASVRDQEATRGEALRAGNAARSLKKALKKINDARLGRDARRGLEDAGDALDQLAELTSKDGAGQLELAEAARRAADGLRRGTAGSRADEREGKQVRALGKRAEALDDQLSRRLPPAANALGPKAGQQLQALDDKQRALRNRSTDLQDSSSADPLPDEGRRGMHDAQRGMQRGAGALDDGRPGRALRGQNRAWDGLQRAIDSLRRGNPPPRAAPTGEASTEAEQDRSLRDQLLDAMREGAPPGYDESLSRYYEELLR